MLKRDYDLNYANEKLILQLFIEIKRHAKRKVKPSKKQQQKITQNQNCWNSEISNCRQQFQSKWYKQTYKNNNEIKFVLQFVSECISVWYGDYVLSLKIQKKNCCFVMLTNTKSYFSWLKSRRAQSKHWTVPIGFTEYGLKRCV